MDEDHTAAAALGPVGHLDTLAGLLSAGTGPADPGRVVELAARALPYGAHCALTFVPVDRAPVTLACTSELARQVDAIQYAVDGPCLQAARGGEVTRIDDFATDEQWPEFARRCVEATTVRAAFSVRLVLAGQDRAAMNFYAEAPNAFDDHTISIAVMVAPVAALVLQSALHAQEAEHLRSALHSSRQIGTAIGILMAREMITSEQAFAELSRTSQRLNRKVRDVAVEVEQTGELPRTLPLHAPARRC